MSFSRLPNELSTEIFGYLVKKDQLNLMSTNKKLHQLWKKRISFVKNCRVLKVTVVPPDLDSPIRYEVAITRYVPRVLPKGKHYPYLPLIGATLINGFDRKRLSGTHPHRFRTIRRESATINGCIEDIKELLTYTKSIYTLELCGLVPEELGRAIIRLDLKIQRLRFTDAGIFWNGEFVHHFCSQFKAVKISSSKTDPIYREKLVQVRTFSKKNVEPPVENEQVDDELDLFL